MAWEELHSGPWAQVSVAWREAYTLATISSAVACLQHSLSQDTTQAEACLRSLDVAVLIGGPRMADVVHPFIKSLHTSLLSSTAHAAPVQAVPATSHNSLQATSPHSPQLATPLFCSNTYSPLNLPVSQRLNTLESIDAPDMLCFEHQYMNRAQPCLMNGVAEAWPAKERCAGQLHASCTLDALLCRHCIVVCQA